MLLLYFFIHGQDVLSYYRFLPWASPLAKPGQNLPFVASPRIPLAHPRCFTGSFTPRTPPKAAPSHPGPPIAEVYARRDERDRFNGSSLACTCTSTQSSRRVATLNHRTRKDLRVLPDDLSTSLPPKRGSGAYSLSGVSAIPLSRSVSLLFPLIPLFLNPSRIFTVQCQRATPPSALVWRVPGSPGQKLKYY